jgi:pyrroloquinoline quinone biosynthesis protein B
MTSLSRRELLAAFGAAALSVDPTHARACSTLLRQPAQPYGLVLGTAQDGGLPQVGCYTSLCDRARLDPRYVASLALVHPSANRYYLVDATPDITRQLDLISEPGFRDRATERRPFDGIFLTHAHIGHYLGLALLGREGMGMAPTPVYCTAKMADFLSNNGPWSLMVEEGRLVFPAVPVDEWFPVDDWLQVRMMPVPHRPEFSDTVGFMFRGPSRSLLYLPDIDRWETWDHDITNIVTSVDASFLDGSFYSTGEVPGRNVDDIPHPLIPHSMDLLQTAVDGGAGVYFIHLNNSNAAQFDGPERESIVARGFGLAHRGMRAPL